MQWNAVSPTVAISFVLVCTVQSLCFQERPVFSACKTFVSRRANSKGCSWNQGDGRWGDAHWRPLINFKNSANYRQQANVERPPEVETFHVKSLRRRAVASRTGDMCSTATSALQKGDGKRDQGGQSIGGGQKKSLAWLFFCERCAAFLSVALLVGIWRCVEVVGRHTWKAKFNLNPPFCEKCFATMTCWFFFGKGTTISCPACIVMNRRDIWLGRRPPFRP